MTKDKKAEGVTIYFNPFAFTIEQNNAFIAAGYEVMPLAIPDVRPAADPQEAK